MQTRASTYADGVEEGTARMKPSRCNGAELQGKESPGTHVLGMRKGIGISDFIGAA